MTITVSAIAIHRGRVIDRTRATQSTITDNATYEMVGMAVMQCVANARAQYYHLADPETWVRVEFREG